MGAATWPPVVKKTVVSLGFITTSIGRQCAMWG